MFARLLIILLIAVAVYVIITRVGNRAGPALRSGWQNDPRVRAAVAGFGLLALRSLLGRLAPGIGRWFSMLRWFR